MNQGAMNLMRAAVLGVGGLAAVAPAVAGMFDFMDPGEWFGGDRDRYYDYGPYGYGGPYGWGGGPYGYGGGPYGWGGGPYGYGGGPYGWGGGPYGYGSGYGPGSTIVVTPQSGGSEQKPEPRLPE